MGKFIDLSGRTFGRLLVIEKCPYKQGSRILWKCRCECGALKDIQGDSLRRGSTQSCGCLALEALDAYRPCMKGRFGEKHPKWTGGRAERLRKQNLRRRSFPKDHNEAIGNRLRSRLYKAVKRGQRAGSAVKDLGCSINDLKEHLASQFQEGMSWGNYGDWHIDHIRPLASFDLTIREEFLKACHYTNLQPLWAAENLAKSAKLA